jgi:hypothetical protein
MEPTQADLDDLKRRLMSKVEIIDGCWLFVGALSGNGYGSIRAPWLAAQISAHVASYLVHVGPIPKRMDVCHTCDVRNCIRPDHLWIGSHVPHGYSGENHGMAQISALQAGQAKYLLFVRHLPQSFVARHLRLPKYAVAGIARGRSWRSVEPIPIEVYPGSSGVCRPGT